MPFVWDQTANNEPADGKKLQYINAMPTSTSQECPITSFEIGTKDKDPYGIEINQTSGIVSIDRLKVVEKIKLVEVIKVSSQTFEMPSIMILPNITNSTDVAYFGIGLIPLDAKPPYYLPVMFIIYPILLGITIATAGFYIYNLQKKHQEELKVARWTTEHDQSITENNP